MQYSPDVQEFPAFCKGFQRPPRPAFRLGKPLALCFAGRMRKTPALALALLCAAGAIGAADKPLVVELWPGQVPNQFKDVGPEKWRMSPSLPPKKVVVTEPTRVLTGVTRPSITIYPPPKKKNNGGSMLICPGGGYWDLYWQLEGEEVAQWVNSLGMTGIILKYRVPRQPDESPREPARRPLQDAQRAISLIRSRATEWGLDPHRIGMVGFSAGGHLAIATATRFDKRSYNPTDDVDKVSCRPDFAILAYPGTLKDNDKNELAPGLSVPPGTPPVFLAHGGADIVSPPEHSVVMYLALRQAGIPAELHIYENGPHGVGLAPTDATLSSWPSRLEAWLRGRGLLNSAGK